MKVVVGIDSGVNGGICVLYPDKAAYAAPVGNITELYDILSAAKKYADGEAYILECFVEEVTGYIGGKPQPASRSFVLGKSYGSILGLLVGMEIPFRTVRPQKWQLGLSGIRAIEYTARKRRLKEIATQRYPHLKPTLKTADAILIADYGRSVCNGA